MKKYATKFDRFLRKKGIVKLELARKSGYSRQHLLRIRAGRMEPTRRCIKAIVEACRLITGEPVHAVDLFDLEDE